MAVNGVDQRLAAFARQGGDLKHRAFPFKALDEIGHALGALLQRHHVQLVQHQPARLVVQRFVVFFQLTDDGLGLRHGIDAVVKRCHINDVQQQTRALQVAQKLVSKASAFRRAFNQAGNIGNHKALLGCYAHHAQIGVQGGEGVIGNFIGVDIKGARFWFGAKDAVNNNLGNVAFLRTQIELIDCFFSENEVDEIWITFPDPQIKYRRGKHRLTHPDFLNRYKNILKSSAIVHLKTDSEFLHGYTLGMLQGLGHEILTAHHDIYGAPEYEPDTLYLREIKTYYEELFSSKGKTITYIKFRLK